VPPIAYGGIEAVVSQLTEELVRRGHDVTLYATADSLTLARLRSTVPAGLRQLNLSDPRVAELVHVGQALANADQFDVIHNHSGELAMAFQPVIRTPMLTTLHGPILGDRAIIWDYYRGYYNCISHSERAGQGDHGFQGVVYNGIDVETFPFRAEKDDYLLFLGRLSSEKGPHHAIEVARRLNARLILAGKVDQVDRPYYEEKVEPLLDDEQIVFIGEADFQRKRELFSRARCLLHPVTWDEPFGLVMTEAMACGTPVIGFRRGSVPEVIADGETGFVVDTEDDMAAAVERLSEIDPHRCRQRVVENFSTARMVDAYERIYHEIVKCDGRIPNSGEFVG
jgi:glycosyltransferase involved in cell wall biosynthesis